MENPHPDGTSEQCGRELSFRPRKSVSLADAEACGFRATVEPAVATAARPDEASLSHPVAAPAGKPAPPSTAVDRSVILESGTKAATIARARAAVLDVLQSENACSDWLGKSDPHVLDTFSSLRFWVERRGPANIVKELDDNGIWVEHGPYVAMTAQGTGAFTNVALNANGAFFQSSSVVSKILWHNGPQVDTTVRQPLHVGPFDGNTLEAQVITLIHELAHVVNAIPRDGLTPSGLIRSQENTEVILEHCKRAAKDGSKRIFAVEGSSQRLHAAD